MTNLQNGKKSRKSNKNIDSDEENIELPQNFQLSSDKREPKDVIRFEPDPLPVPSDSVKLMQGNGRRLTECPNIKKQIENFPVAHDVVVALHKLIYTVHDITRYPVKEDLLEFNGIEYEGFKNRNYWERKVNARSTYLITKILEFVGLDFSGDRELLIPRLVNWLENPKDSPVVLVANRGFLKESAKEKNVFSYDPDEDRSQRKIKERKEEAEQNEQLTQLLLDEAKEPTKIYDFPQKPKTAYMKFIDDNRAQITKENVGSSQKTVIKIIGEMWSKLPKQQKDKYIREAKLDKQRFERDLKLFYEQHPTIENEDDMGSDFESGDEIYSENGGEKENESNGKEEEQEQQQQEEEEHQQEEEEEEQQQQQEEEEIPLINKRKKKQNQK